MQAACHILGTAIAGGLGMGIAYRLGTTIAYRPNYNFGMTTICGTSDKTRQNPASHKHAMIFGNPANVGIMA
jgi:hypothetical protein